MNIEKNKKRIIRIHFKNFYQNFSIKDLGPAFNNNSYLKDNNIELVIDEKNPDFIFYGVFGDFLFEAVKDSVNAVKILFSTEVLSPDFLFFDYCIGFEPYTFGDRYCYYPEYVYRYYDLLHVLSNKIQVDSTTILKKKTKFCDMIYSHDGIDVSRKKYFELLNSYKRVESAGKYLNNQPNGNITNFYSKFELQEKCKFSLCIQSIDKDWFVNEKIIHSLVSDQIPIFYGTKYIKNIFNPERFIFINDYSSDQELLKKIIQIDSDFNLYKSIINKPIFNSSFSYEKIIDDACKFVFTIFNSSSPKKIINKNREEYIREVLLTHFNNSKSFEKFSKSLLFKIHKRIKKGE